MISTAVGMDHVFLSNLQTTQKLLNPDFCMGYTLYEYGIKLTLTNDQPEDSTGWIKLTLKGVIQGNVLDTQYVGVEVPGGTTVENAFDVWFTTSYDLTQDVSVDATPEIGAVKCLVCSGSGKLPLNVWLMASSLKSSLERITTVENAFKPPPYVTPMPFQGD